MHLPALVASIGLIGTSSAFNVFVNEPDTGLTTFLGADTPAEASGTLISLDNIVTIPDFDFAARAYMTSRNYSYYRTGAAGEFCMYIVLHLERFGTAHMMYSLSGEFGQFCGYQVETKGSARYHQCPKHHEVRMSLLHN